MIKHRELTGNRNNIKVDPERDRQVREAQQKVDNAMQEITSGRKTVLPFRSLKTE
jgi:hypothetical protein